MTDLLGGQFDYIFFVHGLAFVLMASTARALTWRQWTAVPWRWFGAFALTAGVAQWIEVSAFALGPHPALVPLRALFAVGAGLLLLEFCRRMAGGRARALTHAWSALALVVIGAALFAGDVRGAIVAFRYLVMLPGCGWAAMLFAREAGVNVEARALRLTSASFGLLALASGLLVPAAGVFPASVLNQEAFTLLTGVPVPLVRSLASLLLAASIWRYYCLLQRADEDCRPARGWRRYETGLSIALALVLVGGWIITQSSTASEAREARAAVGTRAATIAGMLPPRLVAGLAEAPDGSSSDTYAEARALLQSVCASRTDVDRLSLLARRNGRFVYLVDAIPERRARRGARPAEAGSPYQGEDDELAALTADRGPGDAGPHVREAGSRISSLVPVVDAAGRTAAIVDLELDSTGIRRWIARARLFPIFVTLLTGILLVAFFMSERKMSESGVRMAASELRYRGLVEGSPNGILLLDRDGRLLTINQPGLRVLSLHEADVVGCRLPGLWPSSERAAVAAVTERATRGERVTLETRYAEPGGRLVNLELVLNPVADGAGAVTHLVGIITDVTERHRAQSALERSHRFTQVILGISARYLGLRTERVDAATREALREIGAYLEVDRAQLFNLSPDRDRFSLTHEWCIPGAKSRLPVLQSVAVSDYPWMWAALEHAGVVRVGDVDELPGDASIERERLRAQNVSAFLCVPVHRRGAITGFLALDVFGRRREWPDDEVALLRVVADVLSNGLARKLADEALRDSEQRFQKAFRNNPAAMAIFWTENQRIVEANEAWMHLLDRSQPEVVGRTVEELGLIAEPEEAARFTQALGEGEAVRHVELRIRTGEGELRNVSLSMDAFELAGQRFMLAVALDMSARTRAEEALREREEIFRSISAAAQDAIIMIDPDARVTVWNEAAERMFGYTREEAEGQTMHELLIPEEYESGFIEGFGQFRMSGGGPFVGAAQQVFARCKDDSRLPVELSASAVQLRGRWHAVGILRDITERLKVEEALWKAKEETDNANAELQRLVERANRLAEEAAVANASKSDFLANMSHEIRTPMNGIIGMTGLLLDTELLGEQREYVDTVRSCADSLLTIINDILDFSKIEAGKLDLEALDFDLAGALEDTMDVVAIRAQQKGLELACLVPPDVPVFLRGDPGRLRQVLTNLLGNAVKFTAHGEVTLSVSLESSTPGDTLLRFVVRDTGIGIPADKLHTLFQPFTQVDSSTTRRFGGTGLGLSISRRLAEMMGGTVGVESQEGAGSSFWFTARFERQPAPPEVALPGELEGVRILGQDDNHTNRLVLAGMLATWRCRHAVVVSADDALAELRRAAEARDPYRIAILNMKTPDVQGDELGRQIKSDPLLAETALVVMTSVGRRGDAARFREAGFSGYLTKPVKASQLRSLLATLTGRSGPGQADLPMVTRHTVAEAQRRKSRLLLAEDNITNQKVAIKVLEKMGHRVDAVANGAEAIRVLRTMPYDLVFMDVQMPEMDGFEATRRIRDPQTGVRNPLIPIVAMTAHAMKGDRERCLESGMNDYVSKPINPREVADAIARWLTVEPGPGDVSAPAASAVPAAVPPQATAAPVEPLQATPAPVEPSALPTRSSLLDRLGGDEEVFVEVIKIFLEDAPHLLTGMDDALNAGDAKTLRRLAHTLKGSSGTAGAEALQQASLRLEQAATAGNLASAATLIPPVKELAAVVFETMGAWVTDGADR
jgi:PAS domain S-box-containing protein